MEYCKIWRRNKRRMMMMMMVNVEVKSPKFSTVFHSGFRSEKLKKIYRYVRIEASTGGYTR